MSNSTNSQDSWYSPLEGKPDRKPGIDPGRRKGWRIAGVVALVILLIAGSSLAFSRSAPSDEKQTLPEMGEGLPSMGDEMPDDWREYFDNYFTEVQTEKAQINIPAVSVSGSFSLKLEKAGEKELSLQEIYQSCSDSIVAISGYADGTVGYNWGTGVILSADGLILTNTHVIDGCDSAMVTLYDDSSYEAKLVGADSISDVAVLKIDAKGLPAATFGESGQLAVGDKVAAIGNPLGETFRMTLTDGIISAIERGVSYNGHSMTLLQTNTALNEGNSGGALFNMYGQVIGITNMKMMSSYSSIEGIGFAIPSTTVSEVVDSLITHGEVRGRPSIGITVGPISDAASAEYDLPSGLIVSAVAKGSDAEKKGIKENDIIIAVNDQFITTTEEVLAIKNELEVGDTMTFTVWRDGETFKVDVVLVDTNDVY